jgi:hypothetical protein
MDRRLFFTGVMAAALAHPALADSFEGSVVAQLRAQEFKQIVVERTLLGRVRILAVQGSRHREIILNPRTGEILRDVFLDASGNSAPVIASTGSGPGKDGSDDGAGDDDSDDSGSGDSGSDDSEDNSGSGSSNSGSGSSGGSGSDSSGGSDDGGESNDD